MTLHRHRRSSRVLVFDENGRILLMLMKGSVPAEPTRWITPGGGVDEGETHDEGARRELFEETGLDIADIGKSVFSYDFVPDYPGGPYDTGHAEFYVLHTKTFAPSDEHWTPEEKVDVLETRWWSLEELESTTEPFEPPMLLDLIRSNQTSSTL